MNNKGRSKACGRAFHSFFSCIFPSSSSSCIRFSKCSSTCHRINSPCETSGSIKVLNMLLPPFLTLLRVDCIALKLKFLFQPIYILESTKMHSKMGRKKSRGFHVTRQFWEHKLRNLPLCFTYDVTVPKKDVTTDVA